MRKIAKTAMTLAFIAPALALLPAAPAHATSVKRTFVSAAGDDANVSSQCPLNAPCRTFGTAYSATMIDGEIDVLDPASYGTLTITHGISIIGHGWAAITAQNGTAITVNAGANDKINLRGLVLDGAGSGAAGISLLNGGSLNVQDCVIRNFFFDFSVTPSSGTTNVSVSHTLISDGGTGFLLKPSGSATATGVLDLVEIDNSTIGDGLDVVGTFTSGTVNVTVSRSAVTHNHLDGIVSQSSGGTTKVMVRDSTIANNAGTGLLANLAAAAMRVTRSTITGNNTAFSAAGGATLSSYGDNNADDNGGLGSTPSAIGYH